MNGQSYKNNLDSNNFLETNLKRVEQICTSDSTIPGNQWNCHIECLVAFKFYQNTKFDALLYIRKKYRRKS